MPVTADVPSDELAMVYGWMHRLSSDEAVAGEWTLEVMLRFHRHAGPPWLWRCDALLRLRYLSAQLVLERRGIL